MCDVNMAPQTSYCVFREDFKNHGTHAGGRGTKTKFLSDQSS